MARPTRTTSRPHDAAACATARMRATLEAKVVTATRRGAERMRNERAATTCQRKGMRNEHEPGRGEAQHVEVVRPRTGGDGEGNGAHPLGVCAARGVHAIGPRSGGIDLLD